MAIQSQLGPESVQTGAGGAGKATRMQRFVEEIESLKREARASVGTRDAIYIKRVVWISTILYWVSRALILAGAWFADPVAIVVGVVALSVSTIVENMEVGHNVMHGQYDFMNDPKINSRDYEWNIAIPAEQWKNSHNVEHHANANVVGRDFDFGFGHFRFTADTKWIPTHIFQLFSATWLAIGFQHFAAVHDARPFEYLSPAGYRPEMLKPRPDWQVFFAKIRVYMKKGSYHLLRDYVVYPLMAGPYFLTVLFANLAARLLVNLWACTVIFCGHFSDKSLYFGPEYGKPDEPVGHFYLRQITGTCNLEGNSFFDLMTGHLSWHIEHHLFPDIPAHRYPELGERLQVICAKYDVPYSTARMLPQMKSVVARLWKYSLPSATDTPPDVNFDDLINRLEEIDTEPLLRPVSDNDPYDEVIEKVVIVCERSDQTVVTTGDSSLLEALEDAGMEPKFGCRRGRCHTCTCHKISGRVVNTVTGVESDGDELIQLCISRALGDLTIDV